jgi:prepilin-type N-terminal cleavage/methylation domain-containing protein
MTGQRGFTLIEMMISLVLFSLAVTSVLSIVISFSNGMRAQRDTVGTEAAVRVTLVQIADMLRQASPGVPSGTIRDAWTCTTGALTVTNSTTGPDQLDIIHGVGGFATTTRSAYGIGTTSLSVADASQLAVNDYLVISNWSQGHLVKITAINGTTLTLASQCSPINLPSNGYLAGSLAIRAQHSILSIGAADDIPTMMMDSDAGGPTGAEPFAEGIEDLQIAIGVDVNGDGGITEVGASAGDDEWQGNVAGDGVLSGSIRALRATIVARATKQLAGPIASFSLPAAEDRAASTTQDKFRRRVLRSTVESRNLSGSP